MAAVSFLFIAAGCYNSYARDIIRHRLKNAQREPGTNILKGAAPINISEGHDRVCLLLHGYSSSPADFGQLPQFLSDNGWDVRAPLLPAHGRDPRELRNITADDLVAFARAQFNMLKKKYDTVVVGGFSMGGSIALILTDAVRPDATFVINPYLGSTYHFYYVLPVTWWHTLLRPFLDYGVQPPGRVPINRPEGHDAFVHYHAAPASIYAEVFELRSRAHRAHHKKVPVLVLVSEDDDTASPAASKSYFQRTRETNDKLLTFARSNHVLMLDYDRHQAIQAIATYLRNHARENNSAQPSPMGSQTK